MTDTTTHEHSGECALYPGDRVTNTATRENGTVIQADGAAVQVETPDGSRAEWAHSDVIWADDFNPAASYEKGK